MPEDKIEITDLRVRGVIGVNDWEREDEQDILVNLTLFVDLRAAGASDDLEDTVSYRTVSKAVSAHAKTHQPLTLEALAAQLAQLCLGYERVSRVRVRVEKPGAVRFARSVGVEIERQAVDFE
jgi:FolB domain-containing protein